MNSRYRIVSLYLVAESNNIKILLNCPKFLLLIVIVPSTKQDC